MAPFSFLWYDLVFLVLLMCMLEFCCQDSLKSLKEKQQRTVYRLTLVKGWNTEDIDAYYNIFSIGNPDFVEIKGVTYCGS